MPYQLQGVNVVSQPLRSVQPGPLVLLYSATSASHSPWGISNTSRQLKTSSEAKVGSAASSGGWMAWLVLRSLVVATAADERSEVQNSSVTRMNATRMRVLSISVSPGIANAIQMTKRYVIVGAAHHGTTGGR
jgi:hypothetical protein